MFLERKLLDEYLDGYDESYVVYIIHMKMSIQRASQQNILKTRKELLLGGFNRFGSKISNIHEIQKCSVPPLFSQGTHNKAITS